MYWTELYRPNTFQQMIGNEETRLTILKWIAKWLPGTKPILLLGPPGVGKTTIVKIISSLFNFDLVELNASDTRNSSQLARIINPLLENTSLSGKNILLFVDEVDGISGRDDIGGLDFLIDVIKLSSQVPIVLAANSLNNKIKNLSKSCKIIRFKPIASHKLLMFVNYILNHQHKNLPLNEKLFIVKLSLGDVRTMINLLQARCSGYVNQYSNTGIKLDISEGIQYLLSSENKNEFKRILSIIDGNFSDPRYGSSPEERRKDIINALFTSFVSSNLDIKSLSTILDKLSYLDIFVANINERRSWHLLRYMNSLLTKQLFHLCKNSNIKYNQYGISWPLMGKIFSRSKSIRTMLLALSKYFHVSSSTFGIMYFDYFLNIISNNKINISEIIYNYNLDIKYIEIIQNEIARSVNK
ncbi:MAG: AAA family ATPase [Nitrososphaeraceae archaeon]